MLKALAVLLLGYVLLVVSGAMSASFPVDVALNLGRSQHDASLDVPAGGPARLVVLQHGFWRSSWSLWKLERALRAHGYEVLNVSYPSRSGTLQEHARALGERLSAELAARPSPPQVFFVGHSMGGLVIRHYLSQAGAAAPAGVVFLGTPQRGAALARAHYASWLPRLLIGSRAGKQLIPEDPFYAELRPLRGAVGTIIGSAGTADGYRAQILGDDDGRVGIDEARLPEATDSIVLRVGHTSLCTRDDVIAQVVHFLGRGRFAR